MSLVGGWIRGSLALKCKGWCHDRPNCVLIGWQHNSLRIVFFKNLIKESYCSLRPNKNKNNKTLKLHCHFCRDDRRKSKIIEGAGTQTENMSIFNLDPPDNFILSFRSTYLQKVWFHDRNVWYVGVVFAAIQEVFALLRIALHVQVKMIKSGHVDNTYLGFHEGCVLWCWKTSIAEHLGR